MKLQDEIGCQTCASRATGIVLDFEGQPRLSCVGCHKRYLGQWCDFLPGQEELNIRARLLDDFPKHEEPVRG